MCWLVDMSTWDPKDINSISHRIFRAVKGNLLLVKANIYNMTIDPSILARFHLHIIPYSVMTAERRERNLHTLRDVKVGSEANRGKCICVFLNRSKAPCMSSLNNDNLIARIEFAVLRQTKLKQFGWSRNGNAFVKWFHLCESGKNFGMIVFGAVD